MQLVNHVFGKGYTAADHIAFKAFIHIVAPIAGIHGVRYKSARALVIVIGKQTPAAGFVFVGTFIIGTDNITVGVNIIIGRIINVHIRMQVSCT